VVTYFIGFWLNYFIAGHNSEITLSALTEQREKKA